MGEVGGGVWWKWGRVWWKRGRGVGEVGRKCEDTYKLLVFGLGFQCVSYDLIFVSGFFRAREEQ